MTVVAARTLARVVSWIGHPFVFVMVSVTVILTGQMPPRAAWPLVLSLLFSVIIPTAALLVIGVRSGRWKDADVSVREERKRFYPWAVPISALGVLATWLMRAPPFLLRGGVVTFGILVAAALINQRLKISLHTIFAFYCTVILFRIGLLAGIMALALAGLVFWSRLSMGRHTLAENVWGGLLGIGGGLLAAWWPA